VERIDIVEMELHQYIKTIVAVAVVEEDNRSFQTVEESKEIEVFLCRECHFSYTR
jgi:uncharacterized protein YlaI